LSGCPSRGKKLVVLVGQKKAIAIAVRNTSGRRRVETQRVAARRPSEACRNDGTFAPKSVTTTMGWQGIPFLPIIELDRCGPTPMATLSYGAIFGDNSGGADP
jgi:hypothetical protein